MSALSTVNTPLSASSSSVAAKPPLTTSTTTTTATATAPTATTPIATVKTAAAAALLTTAAAAAVASTADSKGAAVTSTASSAATAGALTGAAAEYEKKLSSLPLGDVSVRKSGARGHAEHGWLNSYHTFSFAGYHDARFPSFHSLRVINEDRVSGGEGFGTHPHSNYEIFSYVVSGALSHRDSMGNREVLPRGAVQFTSAGSGMMHSEFNAHATQPVHFLQMWVKPHAKAMGVKPTYQTRHYTDAQKTGRLVPIVSPAAGFATPNSFIAQQSAAAAGVAPFVIPPAAPAPEVDPVAAEAATDAVTTTTAAAAAAKAVLTKPVGGSTTTTTTATPAVPSDANPSSAPAWVHNDIRVFASILEPSQALRYSVAAGRDAYVHVIQDTTGFDSEANLTGLTVNGVALGAGDGAFLRPPKSAGDSAWNIAFVGAGQKGKSVEFLLFDIKRTD